MDEQERPHRRTGPLGPGIVLAIGLRAPRRVRERRLAELDPDIEPRAGPAAEHEGGPHDADHRATVRGTATLDGAPFDADFLGAGVRSDGLTDAVSSGAAAHRRGRYEVQVFATIEGEGCGRAGTEIALGLTPATSNSGARRPCPGPAMARPPRSTPRSRTRKHRGARRRHDGLVGEVRDGSGNASTPGHRGSTRRRDGVRPEHDPRLRRRGHHVQSVGRRTGRPPRLDREQPITFHVDGKAAAQTVPNDGAVTADTNLTVEGGA